jgi:hypothetical protein
MATARKPSTRRKADSVNTELIAELQSWTATNKVSNDPYVKSLLNALQTFENIEALAEINPIEYLPSSEFLTGARRLKLTNVLTIIRNVLVFAPVALTWLAVSKATTAFSIFTKANADAVVNFLEFWQSGYGFLAPEWTISRVGLLDFILIAIVIVLTLTTALIAERYSRQERAFLAEQDARRIELGLALHSYLYSYRKVTPEIVNARVAASVKNLQMTTKAMAQVSKELARDVKRVSK